MERIGVGLIGTGFMGKCDAVDGLKDGLIDDPRNCDFDARRDVPACPAGEDIQKWLYHAEAGDYETAWRTLVTDNPLPAVMGRVCYHPCEGACNRGKLSVAVDFTRPEGQHILRDLALQADVLIETFKPGTMDDWGVGYEQLREINPKLIFASLSGFGGFGQGKAGRPPRSHPEPHSRTSHPDRQ